MILIAKQSDLLSIDDFEMNDCMLDEIHDIMKISIEKDPEGDFGYLENTEEVVKAALKLWLQNN